MFVLISIITTPSKAAESYNQSYLTLIKEEIYHDAVDVLKQTEDIKEPEVYELCHVAIHEAEQKHHIKPQLLETIALVESGRYNAQTQSRVAWPWTVHANGKGHYYKTKQEAVNAVKNMQNMGVQNIDVGCMQINLRYHGKAFANIDDAFDPYQNAQYSAKFLNKLYQKTHDWKKTAMQYHSKDWRKGINYKNRLERQYAEYVRQEAEMTLF